MNLRVKTWVPLLSSALLILSLGGACTQKTGSALNAQETLYLQLSGEPVTLDPSLVEDGLGFRVIVNTMDGLMGYDNSGELRQRLAREVQVLENQTLYIFRLREDAKWSDGVKVTADQIRFALERALNPKTGSKLSGFLREIAGAPEFMEGKATTLSGVKADGDTLTVKLSRPVSYFKEVFALPVTYPLRKDVLEKTTIWDPLRKPEIPSSGAYAIQEYQRDRQIVLRATRPLPANAPKNVVFRIVQDETTGARLFDQQKLDILTRIPSYDQARYEATGRVRTVPFHATYFLSFNFRKAPFNAPVYRRAVAGAVRKAELVKALGTGEVVATSWIPRGLEGAQPAVGEEAGRDPRFRDSVSKVKKQKLASPVTIGFDTSGRNSMLMEKVQSDLQEAFGWKVELKNSDWKTHVREIFSDPPSIYRYGWSSPMQDPIIFLSAFQTGDPFSFSGYSNPAYDRLVDEIRAMPSGERRTKRILEAQKLLIETDAIVVPLYHYVSAYAVGPRVEVYGTNPYGHTRFEEVRLKP